MKLFEAVQVISLTLNYAQVTMQFQVVATFAKVIIAMQFSIQQTVDYDVTHAAEIIVQQLRIISSIARLMALMKDAYRFFQALLMLCFIVDVYQVCHHSAAIQHVSRALTINATRMILKIKLISALAATRMKIQTV